MSGTLNHMQPEPQEIDGWLVHLNWENLTGGPVEVRVEPVDKDNPPAGGITHTVLRQIDIAGALGQLRSSRLSGFAPLPTKRDEAKLRTLAKDGVTDQYLANLAWHYTTRVDAGERHVVEHLAKVLGKSPVTTRSNLNAARKRGLLTSIGTRAGGELTAKARQLLDES